LPIVGFCKLGIADSIPDHSVFGRARHERFREGGEGFSITASLIRADAAKKKRLPGDQPIDWPKAEKASRAVREYLASS
jgi:hypothetical protein